MSEPKIVASSADKTCGECNLYCKVMEIEELQKPANSWCSHCRPGHGCLIYADRPTECRTYSCLWLINEKLGPRWKPSKSRIVLTTSEDGIEVRCDLGFPDAWRKQPYRQEINQWALSGEIHDVTLVVIVGQKMILVTPDREFDLGVVQPDERIVREIDGQKVVNVRVTKASDLADHN